MGRVISGLRFREEGRIDNGARMRFVWSLRRGSVLRDMCRCIFRGRSQEDPLVESIISLFIHPFRCLN